VDDIEPHDLEKLDRDALRVALLPGIGPRTRQALIAAFGTPTQVLKAHGSDLERVPGVGPKLSRRIVAASATLDVDAILKTCGEYQIDVLMEHDERYPRMLREIPDPPGVLFLWGSILPQDALAIAIVGTRHASAYGARQAERLSIELARAGFTIVSGLARGIDASAHRGCLQAGGRTMAVLGGGFLRLYPPEHSDLAKRIREQGGLLSESPPEWPPSSGNFPQRNRVITGMSLGVIVVEAGDRSGALISARHALEQGREVFAVPGRIDSPVSRGCHQLLRDGAKLVQRVDDIIEEVGTLVACVANTRERPTSHSAEYENMAMPLPPSLSTEERQIWYAIGDARITVDQVVAATRLPIHLVLQNISRLELRHLVRRVSGAWLERQDASRRSPS
jgi:DNA processing protein